MIARRHALVFAAGLALLVAATPAAASTFRLTGGMGLTVWPQAQPLAGRLHEGVGLGISGRLMLRLFDHLRLQLGLVQGEFEQDDLSSLKRSLIFVSLEGQVPLFLDAYALAGARLGGSHLVMAQTTSVDAAGLRHVRDLDRWSPTVEPMVALGYLLADKFHLELEGGVALDWADGGLHTSYVVVIGVYFKMWDSGW
ncbi:MAG: hypothetical protein ABIJ09_04205 [Pseudomonadota bacterium]